MAITSKQRRDLLKFIKNLEPRRGRHTELVSVYVPQGYDLNKIINHLAQEQGTATNIKDSTTRKNVIDSLERMIQHLRLFKKTPEHGLAVFSGNVAKREGQQDIQVWSIEPPEPVTNRLYRCDKIFVLEYLSAMAAKKDVYGLVVMDRRDGAIALLRGKSIIPLTKTSSNVPGKTRAGGQCLIPSTLVLNSNGNMIEIEKSSNHDSIQCARIKNFTIENTKILDKWNRQKQTMLTITTKYPTLEIKCSPDHVFFVRDEKIVEKAAKELKQGDLLLMIEKTSIKGKKQLIRSQKYHNSFSISAKGIEKIRKARLSKGFFQKQLAKKSGLTQTAISTIELGKRNCKSYTLKKICHHLQLNYEQFLNKYCKPWNKYGVVFLPNEIDNLFAYFIGYFIGEGTIETDRITLFEQDKNFALKFKKKYDEYFNINSSYKFIESKNYHQLRFTSRPLVRLIKTEFPEIKKALNSKIPHKILVSPNKVLASFLSGFFDAEGYVTLDKRIGLGIYNKKLAQQIQMALLRFSIIASFHKYDNYKNPYSNNLRYTIHISEKQSLKLFKKHIGFKNSKKLGKLNLEISQKSNKSSVRQIAVSGKRIRKIIEIAGYNLELFPKVNSYFRDERLMSKQTFKSSILNVAKKVDIGLYNKLKNYYDFPLLVVKIDNIKVTKKQIKMFDISTKVGNFIANGLVVHNSSQRFERIREGAAKEFYKKVADYMQNDFLDNKDLKGIIIGGPGHTKNELIDGGYINDQLKQKIIAVKDLSYTGEFGLQELVDKSQDVLSNEEIASEKAVMQKFFQILSTKPNQTSYGMDQVIKCIDQGAVDILLISEDIDENLIEKLEIKAESFGTKVEIISTETREGVQLRDLGGIAAILRYEV